MFLLCEFHRKKFLLLSTYCLAVWPLDSLIPLEEEEKPSNNMCCEIFSTTQLDIVLWCERFFHTVRTVGRRSINVTPPAARAIYSLTRAAQTLRRETGDSLLFEEVKWSPSSRPRQVWNSRPPINVGINREGAGPKSVRAILLSCLVYNFPPEYVVF